MPLTPEEVTEAVEAIKSGKTIAEIEALKPLDGKVVIHTTEGFEKFKENFESDTIGKRVKEIGDSIQTDLENLGFPKIKPEEKYYDQVKRIAGELKNSKENWESEKKELLGKIEAGNGVEELQKTYEEKEAAWKRQEEQYKTQITDLQNSTVTQSKSMLIDREIDKFRSKFKDGLPESLINTHIDTVRNALVKSSKLSDDGKSLIIVNEDNTVKKNANFEPVTLDFELKQRFGDVLDAGKSAQGAGGEGGDGSKTKPPKPGEVPRNDKGELIVKDMKVPDTVKTVVDLDDYLQTELKLEGNDFFDAREHLSDGLPLR